MVEIYGKKTAGDKSKIKSTVKFCFDKLAVNADNIVEIIFVSEKKIRLLNFRYRHIDQATDVLSFPQSQFDHNSRKIFGSIVICESIGKKYGETSRELIKHGVLHLLGFDHEKNQSQWRKAESKINGKV